MSPSSATSGGSTRNQGCNKRQTQANGTLRSRMEPHFPYLHDTSDEIAGPGDPTRLHVFCQGSGPPIVLAHGFGGSSRNFLPQARAFRDTHKIWLYDARGHARSQSSMFGSAYGWPALISDFGGVVELARNDPSNPIQHALVVGGLSMGAATALFWTLSNPTVVDGLVLAAYPECSAAQRQWARDFAEKSTINGLEIAGDQCVWGARGMFRTEDAGMIRRGFMEHSSAGLAAILNSALANIPDIVSLAPALKSLGVPTLVVVGGDDARSLAASHELAVTLPKARLAIIERSGHVVNLSQPEAFNHELAQFLADLGKGR